MQLGRLIASLENEQDAGLALAELGDIVLYARVADMAERYAETPAGFVAASVARFAASAEDEAWLGLVGALEQAADPSRTALRRMLEWAIAKDASAGSPAGCGCLTGHTQDQGDGGR